MPGNATVVDPLLDDIACGILCDALIAASFNANDLYAVAKTKLNIDVFVSFGTREMPFEALALASLIGIKGRGQMAGFLRAVRLRRPQNVALLAIIEHYCPSAMGDEPPARPQVDAVINALDVLQARLVNSDVSNIISASHADLSSLADRLARLRSYKSLHDLLQKFQIQQYRILTECARDLRTDPEASSTLREVLLELNDDFLHRARECLAPLEPGSVAFEAETRWIDFFASVLKEIGDARDQLDDDAARRAARQIRDKVLRTEPTRLNGAVQAEAKNLPLQTLNDTIENAAASASLDANQRSALENGLKSLDELRVRLSRRLSEHTQWQVVEALLWELDNVVGRPSATIGEFREYWDEADGAKECIGPLFDADVQAQWVLEAQKAGTAIDSAVAIEPPEWSTIRDRYRDFRREALWQFFRVDGDLSKLCEEVLRIGAPVRLLMAEKTK